jgi:hypothetical protein
MNLLAIIFGASEILKRLNSFIEIAAIKTETLACDLKRVEAQLKEESKNDIFM